jgi:mycothiol synthase
MKDEIMIRTFRWQDLPALVDLINACDAHDHLERATTIAQAEHEMRWPGYLAETDCFLAWAGDRLVGYSDIFMRKGENGQASLFYAWGEVHPEWRRRSAGRALLEATLRRAEQRVPEAPSGPVYLHDSGRDSEAGRFALFEEMDMTRVRYFVNMTRPVGNGLPPVSMPAGYTLRSMDLERDLEAVWRVDVASFADHWGFSGFPLEEFEHWLRHDSVRPDLCYLAEDASTGELAGFALNRIDPDWIAQTGRQEGMVNTLGVLRGHRHQGLGTALLAQSLRGLRDAGMEMAHLWADSENLTGAVRIYERAGFARRKTVLNYRKVLRE